MLRALTLRETYNYTPRARRQIKWSVLPRPVVSPSTLKLFLKIIKHDFAKNAFYKIN